jgi:hypothetical protein
MKTRCSMAVAGRFALLALVVSPALALAACADLWGFDDLTLAPDGASATATSDGGEGDVSSGEAGAAGDTSDSEAGSDSGLPEDDGAPSDGAGAGGDRGDSGDGGNPKDAASDGEANDGAAMARCQSICTSGCCDTEGICQQGTATDTCGTGGRACVNCSKTQSCPLPGIGPCCTSSACGCSATCGL